jgi:TatD DNase family protein
MNFIDTHAHLYADVFKDDADEMLKRAFDAGISHCFLPNIDSGSIESMLGLESRYPDKLFAMMGLHPCSVQGHSLKKELDIVEKWLSMREFCAIGEIGVDLYWDPGTKNIQIDAFEVQIQWAKSLKLPIVIHSRESIDVLIKLVDKHQDGSLSGIFHCFSGTEVQALEIIRLGFMLGIGGPLTYKKSTLPDSVKDIALEYLVLETDSPYLPPVPYRGKRNESSYLIHIAEKLAEIKQVDLGVIAEITSHNAKSLFRV